MIKTHKKELLLPILTGVFLVLIGMGNTVLFENGYYQNLIKNAVLRAAFVTAVFLVFSFLGLVLIYYSREISQEIKIIRAKKRLKDRLKKATKP